MAVAIRKPKAPAIIAMAMDWRVTGTGQTGTLTLAAMVMSTEPMKATATAEATRAACDLGW